MSATIMTMMGCAVALALQGGGVAGQELLRTLDDAAPDCSKVDENCKSTGCCANPDYTCFTKDHLWSGCKATCTMGIDKNDAEAYQTPWECARAHVHKTAAEGTAPCDCDMDSCEHGDRCEWCVDQEAACCKSDHTIGKAAKCFGWKIVEVGHSSDADTDAATTESIVWDNAALDDADTCSKVGDNCRSTGCCTNADMTCFTKDHLTSQCLEECTMGDAKDEETPWECAREHIHETAVEGTAPCDCPMDSCYDGDRCEWCADQDAACCKSDHTIGKGVKCFGWKIVGWGRPDADSDAATTAAPLDDATSDDADTCSKVGDNCKSTGCCTNADMTCFTKDHFWSGCKENCTMGIDKNEAEDEQTPWECAREHIHATAAEGTEHCDCDMDSCEHGDRCEWCVDQEAACCKSDHTVGKAAKCFGWKIVRLL